MKTLVIAILTVVGLAIWTNADEEIRCTREGPMCIDCTTIAYCEKTDKFTFTVTNKEKCVVNFVCDEWNLQCVRGGTCRYAPFSCPTDTTHPPNMLVPDPYSCTGYYSCDESYPYQCGDGLVFHNNTCLPFDEDKSCNDYPVLCEEADQVIQIEEFSYVCKEETIDGIHTIHPVLQM